MELPLSSDAYHAHAADYAEHARDSPYNAHYDRPAVLELLGDVDGRDVLDAGCGPGFYAAELLARGARVTGCDESQAMVDLARRQAGGAELRRHDLNEPLDWLPDGSMDLVVMALVVHYLTDRTRTFRDVHRVLRPGGRLVVSTRHPTTMWTLHGGSYFTAGPVEETWEQGWKVRLWRQPLERWCAEFADAGFVIERLMEPRPVDAMAERYPDDHAKLLREPGFIAFRLAKAG